MDAALTGLSSQCQSSLPRLLTSDFASCANILSLVQVATASGSIIEPLTDYISSVCTQDPCTQAQLNNASSIVTNACQSDIESGSIIPTALNTVIEQYGGVRSLLCTQHQGNGSYCVPEVLSAAQNATGTQLTISALTSLASGDQASTFLDAIPSSVYCTDCGDAITTEALAIVQNVDNSSVSSLTQAASQKCGANFGDGQLPSGIIAAGATGRASTSSSSTTGAAPRGLALGGKTFALIGTISAALLGASMTIA